MLTTKPKYKIRFFSTLLFLSFSILLSFFYSCSQKGKVFLFSEDTAATSIFNKVNGKVIFKDKLIKVSYLILSLYKRVDGNSRIVIENKGQGQLKIIQLDWTHYYKNQPLEYSYTITKHAKKEKHYPITLHSGESDISDFFTSKRLKDFEVGDTITVSVSIVYEYKNRIYRRKFDDVKLICKIINLPSDMW